MKGKIILILILLFLNKSAFAEGNCPDGYYFTGRMIEGQGVSYPECAPAPQNTQKNQIPQIHWVNRWGAVAISSKSISGGPSVVGAATNQASKSKAQKAATAECRTKGGAKCIVKLAYFNQCAAIAWGEKGYNLVNAENIEKATKTAMQTCNAIDSNCQIYYSACSLAERIP